MRSYKNVFEKFLEKKGDDIMKNRIKKRFIKYFKWEKILKKYENLLNKKYKSIKNFKYNVG